MLDPLPIGEEEPRKLKCENCGLEFEEDLQSEDFESIDETGVCVLCKENPEHFIKKPITR